MRRGSRTHEPRRTPTGAIDDGHAIGPVFLRRHTEGVRQRIGTATGGKWHDELNIHFHFNRTGRCTS